MTTYLPSEGDKYNVLMIYPDQHISLNRMAYDTTGLQEQVTDLHKIRPAKILFRACPKYLQAKDCIRGLVELLSRVKGS